MKLQRTTTTPASPAKPRWFARNRTAILFVSLCSLVVCVKLPGLLLWARIRILTSLPKTAIADDPTPPIALDAKPEEFDSGLTTSNPKAATQRDPFQVDPATFPTPLSVRSAVSTEPTETQLAPASESAPVGTLPTEEELRRSAHEALQREVDSFRLQSAGRGFNVAVIDGRTYRIGDTIVGPSGVRFVLCEIRDGAAVLVREDSTRQAVGESNGATEKFVISLRGYSQVPAQPK